MNSLIHDDHDFEGNAGLVEAERSLRLIASLAAPVGIEERVKAGLRGNPSQTGVIAWPLLSPKRGGWAQVSYLRAAAAAAIVVVVAGGGWGVYAHFGPGPAPAAEAVPLRVDGGSGLATAGAKRTPTTVEGPKIAVPENVKKETGAGSVATRQRLHGVRGQDKKSSASTPQATAAVR